jgi:hypothetical protein
MRRTGQSIAANRTRSDIDGEIPGLALRRNALFPFSDDRREGRFQIRDQILDVFDADGTVLATGGVLRGAQDRGRTSGLIQG